MKTAKSILIIALLLCCTATYGQTGSKTDMKKMIDGLMEKMTLDEKLGQLNLPTAGDFATGELNSSGVRKKIEDGLVGGLFNIKSVAKIKAYQTIAVQESRLKIPLLFGMDVIHGYQTVFPIPLAQSCSWDPELIRKCARIAAVEASADGINWTFSPMLDICRDPRWGRIAEGAGEDPFLASKVGVAMVKGYQGDNLADRNTLMSCVKHFALYGASEAGRDYNTTDMSRIRMYNEYLPPYKAAVEAGAGSVMASFNEIDGVPATANKWLLTDLLRKQWGFKGFVVSDYTGISEMIDHGLGNLRQVSMLALKAGVNMDMVSEGFLSTLKISLKEGKITQQEIDAACRGILEAKYKLGLFDDPYRYCDETRAKQELFTPEHLQLAREAAAKSSVLLKNEGNVLPLKSNLRIAVVGPMANNRENMTGTWSVAADFSQSVTLVEGIRQVAGDQATISWAKGSNFVENPDYESRFSIFGKPTQRDNRPEKELIAEAVAKAQNADVVVAAVGEASEMSGECSSISDISLPGNQQRLLQALLETGKPVVMVLFSGRPMCIQWASEHVPAILAVWFGGTEAGLAIADNLFGKIIPSGKLSTTFPRGVGQIPIYYNHKNTGRPLKDGSGFQKFRSNYLDIPNDPLYPFGYGLSYSAFRYENLKLSRSKIHPGDKLDVTVDLTNVGKYDAEEVVQLYLHDQAGSVTRPVKELKGFQKLYLKKGEKRSVTFTLTEDDLKFYNSELRQVAEPGLFDLYVGGNSKELLQTTFELL